MVTTLEASIAIGEFLRESFCGTIKAQVEVIGEAQGTADALRSVANFIKVEMHSIFDSSEMNQKA